jgi:hypothetical protein
MNQTQQLITRNACLYYALQSGGLISFTGCPSCPRLGKPIAQGLPKKSPKKVVLSCFDLLGDWSKTLINQSFWAVLFGNVIQGYVPYCCTLVGKRAIFKPILNGSNPWGA